MREHDSVNGEKSGTTELQDEQSYCRICFETEDLIRGSVCACRGSAGAAHLECLAELASMEWPKLDAWCRCPTCKQEYVGFARLGLAQELDNKLESKAEGDPSKCWATGNTIRALCALGQHGAVELATSNLKARELRLGTDHHVTMRSLSSLGHSLSAAGRVDEALDMHRRAQEIRTQALGANHPETLSSVNDTAATLHKKGLYLQAATLLEQNLNTFKQVFGEDHPFYLSAAGNLACSLHSQGSYLEAAALHERSLEVRRRLLGPRHPSALKSASNLASSLRAEGKLDRAVQLHREVWEARRSDLGCDHADTLKAGANLAASLRCAGQLEEAVSLFSDVHQALEKAGTDSAEVLRVLRGLADARAAQGESKEAVDTLREIKEKQEATLGENHPEALLTARLLAGVLAESSKDSVERCLEAEMLRRSTLLKCQRVLGMGHPETLMCSQGMLTGGHQKPDLQWGSMAVDVTQLQSAVDEYQRCFGPQLESVKLDAALDSFLEPPQANSLWQCIQRLFRD